jgi:CheY-like chemotaxis protein
MQADFHILLIEDSPADVVIIERALKEGHVAHRLTVLRDLNLPGPDGYQVLCRLKSDPDLRSIPVVVLTTSGREEDILQTYRAGANTYIQKPSEYPQYREMVQTLRKYWNDIALRPPRGRPRG